MFQREFKTKQWNGKLHVSTTTSQRTWTQKHFWTSQTQSDILAKSLCLGNSISCFDWTLFCFTSRRLPPPVCGTQSKDAGIRTLVMLDEQGGECAAWNKVDLCLQISQILFKKLKAHIYWTQMMTLVDSKAVNVGNNECFLCFFCFKCIFQTNYFPHRIYLISNFWFFKKYIF